MGKEISLFSGYDQPENRTTNYCLLMLRMLYQENPKLLAETLATLLPGQADLQVGVQFRQQVLKGNAMPDGIISQPAFSVYVETKHSDWHYDEQLERHLEALDKEPVGAKVLVALAKFDGDIATRFTAIETICATRYEGKIKFIAASFEQFLAAVRSASLTLSLTSLANDFEQYLNEISLLPNWRKQLDVVNCGEFHSLQVEAGVYVCPAQGGPYSHRRCEYIGMYWDKAVHKVASILGVVDVDPAEGGTAEILWNNDRLSGLKDEALIQQAQERFYHAWPDRDWVGRVFVLGPLFDTYFEKDSPGGMQGSKQYFWVGGDIQAQNAEELAVALNGLKWSGWN
ncbi:hypothetical protein [Hymenobacter bucti]|uniref:PD-(D/E)XK nuclease family protein n=1 Tax=Hymenobacter bucti TaxID=1844114 RepID=A0ABW4QXJ8_9BACT